MTKSFIPRRESDAANYPRLTELRESEYRHGKGLWIWTYCKLFQERDNPIDLMQAFTIAMKLDIYPPAMILRTVNSAFQRVLDGAGKVSLDKAFGLKANRQGGWNAYTLQKRRGLQFWLAANMYRLIEEEGFTIAEAAEEVSRLTEKMPMKRYSPNTLIDKYSRTWKKQFQHELTMGRTPTPRPYSRRRPYRRRHKKG